MIFYILGKMMGVEGIVLLIPAFVSLLYQEKSGFSFLIVSAVLILIYFVLGRKEPKSKRIYSKEGFAIVGLAWLLWSAFGALPFVISGSIPHYIDAFFETVSGFTTTGSTILTEIEILPKGIAFWRSFTHWIGGMGVLVFVMMITSLDDDNAMPLMRAEVPGPEADKLVPKARRTAKILYGMYFALTAVETVFLMAGGMSFFDALLHAFSTAGTGGFSNKNASVGFFDSAYIDGVITVFMILFGINFNLYFLFLLKEWKTALKNEELWVYLGIIGASMAAITGNILHIYGNIFRAFRYASFQVASVIKVSRLIILWKSVRQEVRKILHPNAVTVIRVNGRKIGQDTLRNVNIYLACYVLILVVSTLLVSIDNFDFATSFSGVLTTLSNVGPGISQVGPVMNFHKFSVLSKLVFCFDMLAGRLEIFPYLLLFSPDLWRRRF